MWIDQRGSEVLERPEALRLLALAARGGAVGRIGLSRDGGPVIQPVQFTFHDRLVLVRIGAGSMVEDAPGKLVSFEVDSFDPAHGVAWSVLVKGLALRVADDSPLVERAPRPAVPEPGSTVLSIRPDVVTGRRFRFEPESDEDGGDGVTPVQLPVPEVWTVAPFR